MGEIHRRRTQQLTGSGVKRRHAVICCRFPLRRKIALTLHGAYMQQHGTALLPRPLQRLGQRLHVVTVYRPHIGKAHALKHGTARQQCLFQRGLDIMAHMIQLLTHGAAAQQLAIPLFECIIPRPCPQPGQMAADRPHIGRNGHAVVIENHDHRLTGSAGIVQPLKAETAAQCAVTDQRQHIVVLMLHSTGPGHTQRHRHRVGGMSRHKSVMYALVGLGEPGDPSKLPQGIKPLPAAR